MKSLTPAANIVIGTLYLLIIIAIGYVIKLSLKPKCSKKSSKPPKYSVASIAKGLKSPLMQNNISPIQVVLKSYALKHSTIGSLINQNKFYLLKEVFIMAIIGIACCNINSITLWPIALAIVFSVVAFVTVEVFKLPFVFNANPKIDQENKIGHVRVGDQQVQLEPGLIVGQTHSNKGQASHDQQSAAKGEIQKTAKSWKYLVFMSILSLVTLVLVSQTMLTIYNSVSNLGALNIGSVVVVILIDQFACRPILAAVLILTIKVLMHVMQHSQAHYIQNGSEVKHSDRLRIFDWLVLKNLCEQELISKMNQIYAENGQPSDYEMGASPTRKKTFSPSKVPKANPLVIESQTLMHLEDTKRIQHQQQEQKIQEKVQQENQVSAKKPQTKADDALKSPIKQIEQSMLQESSLFTTVEKQMFNQEGQNIQMAINKSVQIGYNTEKIKVNPNQYFSAQRLPKQQLNPDLGMDEDGLVLVQAGLNLIKERPNKQKPSTIDIDFSPTKKRKKPTAFNPKKRQLIITGSSPYLQYLPDMMKKDKNHKKNQTPSQPQIPTVSRKLL